MGKNKKKPDKAAEAKPADVPAPGPEQADGVPAVAPAPAVSQAAEAPAAEAPAADASVPAETRAAPASRPQPRWRRGLPDLIKVALALAVIGLAAAIWLQPPLTLTDFPYVSYQFQGQTFSDAQLYRPLAMPTRYYIRLPQKLADRYEWFAVDRRREVVALSAAPAHRLLGRDAIRRSDPLGLDLEFRKLDHSEWQIFFLHDAIVFSNTVLTVRMDTKRDEGLARP